MIIRDAISPVAFITHKGFYLKPKFPRPSWGSAVTLTLAGTDSVAQAQWDWQLHSSKQLFLLQKSAKNNELQFGTGLPAQ